MVNADVLRKLGHVCYKYITDNCSGAYDFETRPEFQVAEDLGHIFYSLANEDDSNSKDYEQEVQSILDKRIRGMFHDYFIELEKAILEVLNENK